MVYPTCPSKKISGGQQEEGHGVVHHLQQEHYQSMKEWFNKKGRKIRMVHYGSPYLSSKKILGGQRDLIHEVVQHIQREHHQSIKEWFHKKNSENKNGPKLFSLFVCQKKSSGQRD